jgi:hypothetical protein
MAMKRAKGWGVWGMGVQPPGERLVARQHRDAVRGSKRVDKFNNLNINI